MKRTGRYAAKSERALREIARVEAMGSEVAVKDVMVVRLNRIFEAGMRFQESLWFARGKARDMLRENMEKYPQEFAAKQKSFALIMNKALPTKLEHRSIPVESKQVSVEDLEQAGLSMDQIRELAFPGEKGGENV